MTEAFDPGPYDPFDVVLATMAALANEHLISPNPRRRGSVTQCVRSFLQTGHSPSGMDMPALILEQSISDAMEILGWLHLVYGFADGEMIPSDQLSDAVGAVKWSQHQEENDAEQAAYDAAIASHTPLGKKGEMFPEVTVTVIGAHLYAAGSKMIVDAVTPQGNLLRWFTNDVHEQPRESYLLRDVTVQGEYRNSRTALVCTAIKRKTFDKIGPDSQ